MLKFGIHLGNADSPDRNFSPNYFLTRPTAYNPCMSRQYWAYSGNAFKSTFKQKVSKIWDNINKLHPYQLMFVHFIGTIRTLAKTVHDFNISI